MRDAKQHIMTQLVLERHRVLDVKQKCDGPARFLAGSRFNDRDLHRLQFWVKQAERMPQNNFHKC